MILSGLNTALEECMNEVEKTKMLQLLLPRKV